MGILRAVRFCYPLSPQSRCVFVGSSQLLSRFVFPLFLVSPHYHSSFVFFKRYVHYGLIFNTNLGCYCLGFNRNCCCYSGHNYVSEHVFWYRSFENNDRDRYWGNSYSLVVEDFSRTSWGKCSNNVLHTLFCGVVIREKPKVVCGEGFR